MSNNDKSSGTRRQAIANALASLALEGRHPSPELLAKLDAYATGSADMDTLVEEVIQRHLRRDQLLLPLIREGALPAGTTLTCPLPGVQAEVTADGLLVQGGLFTDPTAAMGSVTGTPPPDDAGWEFWKLEDHERGFTKPLEHVRVAHANRHKADHTRTSDSHPLRINTLGVPGLPGEIGMTFCPGKKSDSIYGGRWDRDLEKDLAAIRAWGAAAVVTLMEEHEFGLLGIPDFPEVMTRQPFAWHLLRIRDSDVPAEDFEERWPIVRDELIRLLSQGHRILIHCRGGLGRTGLVTARLLVETGMPAEEAIQRVRAARPGAIETWGQRAHVIGLPSPKPR